MNGSVRKAAVALGVVATAALATALPGASGGVAAKATKAKAPCPEGAMCVWDRKRFKGDRLVLRKPIGTISNKMNDRASSVKNNYEFRAWLYEDVDGGGQGLCIAAGDKKKNLGAFFDEFNNDASSSLLPANELPCV